MKKYTANYTRTNPNFVIQNLADNTINEDFKPILYVLKNILQRGFPTILSKYLQTFLGEIHKQVNFNDIFIFASNQVQFWHNTINGDEEHNYYLAKEFFYEILPKDFG
jgi:ATP-dependent DNA helicase RecQ